MSGQYYKSKGKKQASDNPGGLLDKETNGQKSRKSKQLYKQSSSSSGLCVKSLFFMLLSTFTLVGTLIYFDYQPGQLKEAYTNQLPPEVRIHILRVINFHYFIR
jgi:hypothetical protein